MTAGAWRRAALGRLIDLARRGTPRLERYYAQLPASAGLAVDADEADQEQRLLTYYRQLAAAAAQLPEPPRFSILIPEVMGADPRKLGETVRSLQFQLWDDWEVCIATGGAPPPAALRVLGDRVRNTVDIESLAAAATGTYICVLRPGDRLYPSALAEMVRAIDMERRLTGVTPSALYSDERRIDDTGRPVGDPVFKPAWSPILLRGGDYVGGLAVYRRELFTELGVDPRDRHATALATVDRGGMTHVPHVLVQRREAESAGQPFGAPPFYGRVSVVIPTRDRADLLRTCLDSVLTRTSHPDLEVIVVDNGTTAPDALALLTDVARDGRVTVVAAPGPFNFGRLCNTGVRAATGSVVILLNNDTEVVMPGWAAALAGWACAPGVGAVGAQLRYPDGRIQHAGLAGMAEAGTGHLFLARDPTQETPLNLITATREVLAVTGACLAVSKERFESVGGLDEFVVANDSGDIDLCLRLREQGLVSVYAPAAVLVHHESHTRGRSFVDFERFYLQRRWPDALLRDPFLNPNLAKSTRYEPDPRFGIADIPPALFDRWLAAGAVG